ncbi:hypothetical protein NPIL_5341, partial [Nephila pilipes]
LCDGLSNQSCLLPMHMLIHLESAPHLDLSGFPCLHQLKTALMSHLPDSWIDVLPLVLLRIQRYKNDGIFCKVGLWNYIEAA